MEQEKSMTKAMESTTKLDKCICAISDNPDCLNCANGDHSVIHCGVPCERTDCTDCTDCKTTTNWEEEFDKEWQLLKDELGIMYLKPDRMKKLISQTLKQQKEEILKKVYLGQYQSNGMDVPIIRVDEVEAILDSLGDK